VQSRSPCSSFRSPPMTSVEDVVCHRCGHPYVAHLPTCRSWTVEDRGCDCSGFRWVDPASAPDTLGYHRRADPLSPPS